MNPVLCIGELLKDKQLNFVACGLKSAYVSKHAPESFVALMSKHYHRLQPVKDYQDIDDVLFKFSLNLPDQQIPFVVDALLYVAVLHYETRDQRLRLHRLNHTGIYTKRTA